MTDSSRSAWPTLGHENESSVKRPAALRERANSNLDPGVPVFIPNPQAPTYVSPAVPRVELNPRTRLQDQEDPQSFHQQRQLPRQIFVPPLLAQHEVYDPHESDHYFDRHQRVVATLPLSPFPFNASSIAHVDTCHPAIDTNVAAFFEELNPFINVPVKEAETAKKIKQSGRAARWREKKAFEADQRAQIESPDISYYEDGEVVGRAHELAPGSVDENEWKFEKPLPLPLKTQAYGPGFCRADGSWVKTSAIRDDGRDRAAFELHHRVGLNRQQSHGNKAPIKPIARLMHEEVRGQWYSNERAAIRLNESMSGYATRVAEMKDMSEQELESLMRDREIGTKVKEIALIYQGVTFPLQKEYCGNGIWR